MTTLNIGLNNNPRTINEIIAYIQPIHYRIDVGEYVGEVEPTLVIAYDEDDIDIEEMCVWMTQECIAAKVNGKGLMIFNPGYDGEKFEFNQDYFIEL